MPDSRNFLMIKSLHKTIRECQLGKINSNHSNQRIKTKRAAKRIIIWLQSLTAARVRIRQPQDPLRAKSRVGKRIHPHTRSQTNTLRVIRQHGGRRTLKSPGTRARRPRVQTNLKFRFHSRCLNPTRSKRHNLSQSSTTCSK